MLPTKTLSQHQIEVSDIQHTVTHISHNRPLSLRESHSNTLRDGKNKNHFTLSTLNKLNSVIHFNSKENLITVEPRITFDELVRFSLKQSYIPLVVPEFKHITVGGALAGAALESSSFRYGQFSDTITELEVVLGDGSLLTASPKENSDLFYALFGSYGTLGIVTAITLKLKRTAPFVKIAVSSLSSLNELTSEKGDFLEGLAFEKGRRVKIVGHHTLQPAPLETVKLNKSWSPWYYQLIDRLSRSPKSEISLPLYDYLFRYDRGAFWMGRFFSPSKHPLFLFRLLFGWALTTQSLYKMLHRLKSKRANKLFFIHDFYLPFEKAEEGYQQMQKQNPLYPVWFCPVKGTQTPQIFAPHLGGDHFINLGFYGRRKSLDDDVWFEKWVAELKGRKMLYSHCFYSETLFSNIYDLKTYEHLRKKYFATNTFVSLYEKITELV